MESASKLKFVHKCMTGRENLHRREFLTGMTFWSRFTFTWWLGHFISRYVKVHFMLIKYMCDSKSDTLRMRYPFQSTDRPISHRNVWSFRVYMIPLRDFVPEWDSRPGTTTGMNSRRHGILWWYHVSKCRAISIADVPDGTNLSFHLLGNDRRPSQKSGTRWENRNGPDYPDLSPSIPDDRGYLRFRVFISQHWNLGQ